MKSVFGLVGILIVLAIVGLLIKTQLKPQTSSVAPAAAAAGIHVQEGASPAAVSEQIQQQVKDQINAASQAAQKSVDDK